MDERCYIKNILLGIIENFKAFVMLSVDDFYESYTGKLTSKIAMADLISKVHVGLSDLIQELRHEED